MNTGRNLRIGSQNVTREILFWSLWYLFCDIVQQIDKQRNNMGEHTTHTCKKVHTNKQCSIYLYPASFYERKTAPCDHSAQMFDYIWMIAGWKPVSTMFFYLVVHGFLLADQLRAQDQHLLLADVQLLTGGVELLQEYFVSRGARGPCACSCVTQQALPHLRQVMFQLLVLWLQLLTLRSERVKCQGTMVLITGGKWGFLKPVVSEEHVQVLLLYSPLSAYLQGLVLQLRTASLFKLCVILKQGAKHGGLFGTGSKSVIHVWQEKMWFFLWSNYIWKKQPPFLSYVITHLLTEGLKLCTEWWNTSYYNKSHEKFLYLHWFVTCLCMSIMYKLFIKYYPSITVCL